MNIGNGFPIQNTQDHLVQKNYIPFQRIRILIRNPNTSHMTQALHQIQLTIQRKTDVSIKNLTKPNGYVLFYRF